MVFNRSKRHLRLGRPTVLAAGSLLTLAVGILLAHEGHAPLPSKGAEVNVAKGFIRLSPDARSALDVQATEIGKAAKPDMILAYATLVAPWKGHAYAVSGLPGRIVTLKTRPGDQVFGGQVLAEVQSQESETLQLEVLAARTEVTLTEQLLMSQKESAGAIPERDILNAEVQLQQAKNALELAKTKWIALGLPSEMLRSLLNGSSTLTPSLPIVSPVGGTIIHADLSVGKVVEPGEHLFEVIDLSTIWARVGVLEKDIIRVVVGQPVEVRLTAYPGETFRGTVAIVGQYLDPKTHLNDVWVKLHNTTGAEPRLLPGMSGEARIELPVVAGAKTVPLSALINDGVDRFVLVEEASALGVSEYRKKSVAVVRETLDTVEIQSPDLFPGDRVVTRGSHELGTFFAPGVLRLSPESARTIGLNVEPAKLQNISTLVDVPGTVYLPPDRRSVATARLPGTISAIHVDPGQRVKAGDVLAEVFSLDLLNLQLDLLREELSADLAVQQMVRLKVAKESVPKRRLVEAEAAVESAAHKRDSIRRRLTLVGLTADQLDRLSFKRVIIPSLPVRASLDGTIVTFDRVIGQTVRAEELLFEIHDLAKPWLEAFVSERELARVRLGQTTRVRMVSEPGVVLNGKVTRSGRTFGNSHRTLSAWVELDGNPPNPLRQNQMARLSLDVELHPPSLAVPLGAVVRNGTRSFVFVRTGDTFDRREVTLGRIDDRFAEVKSGLAVGELIAVTAAEELNTAWASVR